MRAKIAILVCAVLVPGLVGSASAAALKVDLSCTSVGTKKGGEWLDFQVPGGCDGDRHDPRYWTDPGTNISFGCGQPGGHGNVIQRSGDPICNTAYQQWENEPADMMLQIYGAGHTAGSYSIEVLHAWGSGSISGLSVTGASTFNIIQQGVVMNTTSDDDLLAATQNHTIVDYTIDTDGQSVMLTWSGVPKINAWILTGVVGAPNIEFDETASAALEAVSTATLTVNLNDPIAGQTYTVDYAVSGGTATGCGVDYHSLFSPCYLPDLRAFAQNWLWTGAGFNRADFVADGNVDLLDFSCFAYQWLVEQGTLVFEPGQTSETIEISIMNDDLDEDDETIEVTLFNPTGLDVVLGEITTHTYTILDPLPYVSFVEATSSGMEDVTPVDIEVYLSAASTDTVTVDYAVTDGTGLNQAGGRPGRWP